MEKNEIPDAEELPRMVSQTSTGESEEQTSGLAAANGAAIFNLDQAVKICYGRYEIFQEILDYFFADADDCVEQIRAAWDRGDAEEVGFVAHRLKGTLVYLGAPLAVEATQHLEDLGRSDDPTDTAEAIEEFARRIELLKEAVAPHHQVSMA